jgi:Trk K+ transport system NAD-binding subunit
MQNVTDPFSEDFDELLNLQPQLQPEDENELVNWQDHIIICGLHELGFRILEQLQGMGVPLVVVDDDPDPRLVRRIKRLGIKLIKDDSRLPETLMDAGIYNASAIIACEENDLHNLETVLVANDLAFGIRAVASFFNQRVGQQLAIAVSNAKILSLSEKAGPSFVEACVPSSVLHLFKIEGQDVAVVEAQVSEISSLNQLFGTNTPLIVHADRREEEPTSFEDSLYGFARGPLAFHSQWEVCPPLDYVVQPGQSVILAGRVQELKKLPGVRLAEADVQGAISSLEAIQNIPGESTTKSKKPPNLKSRLQNRFRKTRRLLGIVFSDMGRPFRIAASAVLVFMLFSTSLLSLFYHSYLIDSFGRPMSFTPLDALYFTVTILATVGFGDYNFAQQAWGLKVFGIFLTLVGTATISILYAFLTNFIVSRRIEETLGRHRATDMENHIIICGLGSVGYQVMQGLIRQGHQVAVIEKNERGRFNSEAQSQGVPIIYGDAKLPQVLKAVNIHQARAIAIMTSDDLANMETALSAHSEFHKDPRNDHRRLEVVLRVFDNNLAERVAKNFDIYNIYSPSALAAPYFVGAALDYEVVTTFYIDRRAFMVARMVIRQGSELDGLSVQQLYEITQLSIIAYKVRSGLTISRPGVPAAGLNEELAERTRPTGTIFHPAPDFEIKGGDTVYFIGPYDYLVAAYQFNKQRRQI